MLELLISYLNKYEKSNILREIDKDIRELLEELNKSDDIELKLNLTIKLRDLHELSVELINS